MENRFSVKDKVIIVTGAARGIGFAYAGGLLQEGAKVAICDRNQEALDTARAAFAERGYAVLAEPMDVTVQSDIEAFLDKVEAAYGHIDGIVNNAGVLLRRTPEEMSEQDWDFMIDVNMKGTFLCAQAVGKRLIRRNSGFIVNIASIGGRVALDRRLGYCTTKAAVEHFTRVLAFEWGKYNIRVNAIAPGYIKSDMNADLRADPVRYKAMVDDVPLGRFGETDDLVGPVIFLCSDAAAFVSGQTLYVDGGKTTH